MLLIDIGSWSSANVTIRNNTFLDNIAMVDLGPTTSYSGSQFSQISSGSILTINAIQVNVFYNIFSNPASRYDLETTYSPSSYSSSFIGNAAYNYWASSDDVFVRSRVLGIFF